MKQKTQSLIVFILVGLVGAAYFYYITGQGAVVGFDSYYYLRSAEGLISGQGFGWQNADGTFEAMSHFPPGYPALLAGIARLGNLSPLDASRWAVVLTATLVALLTAVYLHKMTANWGAVAFGFFLTTLFGPLLVTQMATMSESLFLVLFLCYLLAFQSMMERSRTGQAVLVGLMVALMLMTRFAAMGVLLAGLAAILFLKVDDLKTWFRLSFWMGLVAALPLAIWLWVSGGGTNRTFSVHLPDAAKYELAWETIQGWFVTTLAKYGLHTIALGALGLSVILVLIIWIMQFRRPAADRQMAPRPRLAIGILLAYVIVYPIFLWVSSSFLDASTRWTDRILSPWLFAMSLFLIIFITSLVNDCNQKILRWLVVAVLAVLCIANGYEGLKYARQLESKGDGLTAKALRKSEILAQVKELPSDQIIYTNSVPIIYFNANREAISLPTKMDTIRNVVSAEYEMEYQEMLDAIHAGKAVLVIFKPYSDKDGIYPTMDELTSELEQFDRTEEGFFLK